MRHIILFLILLGPGCAKIAPEIEAKAEVDANAQIGVGNKTEETNTDITQGDGSTSEVSGTKGEINAENMEAVGIKIESTKTEETAITTTQGAGSTNNDSDLMKDINDNQSAENKKLQNIIGIMFVLMMVSNFLMLMMVMSANRGRRKDAMAANSERREDVQLILNKLIDDSIKDGNK